MARGLTGGGIIRFGLVGSADILGLMAPNGQLIAMEVKTGSAEQTEQQVAFERMVKRFGGRYAVVRSVEEAVEFLDSDRHLYLLR